MDFIIRLGFWILYAVVIVGGLVVMLNRWVTKRRTRNPLGEDIRLRRQPGEQLRMDVAKHFEGLFRRILMLMFGPVAVFWAVFTFTFFIKDEATIWRLIICFILFLISVGYCYRLINKKFIQIANLRLGWFGERVVADQLEVLRSLGYDLFHDVPCVGGSGSFNLDHVVVGKGIVMVIETKTLRKVKNQKDAHKVTYCGQALHWPWGRSTRELEQVLRNAAWLRQELRKNLNLDVVVHAGLTMPGWYIIGGPPHAPVLVESYKRLAGFIVERLPPRLTDAETSLVSLFVGRLSSNVSYADLE